MFTKTYLSDYASEHILKIIVIGVHSKAYSNEYITKRDLKFTFTKTYLSDYASERILKIY